MIECNEPGCATCAHREVCKFKEDFAKAQTAVNDVMVSRGDRKTIYLRDIAWIHSVDLRCKHYTYSRGGTVK